MGEFLIEISENPDLLKAYRRDPAAFLSGREDLSEDQRAILRSRDTKRIRDAISEEYGAAGVPLPIQHLAIVT